MKRNSIEIEELLFNKQLELYIRIDNLINKQFDELEADVMSVLTRTLMDLEDRIQLYKKELERKEMYGITYEERNNLNKKKAPKYWGLFYILLELIRKIYYSVANLRAKRAESLGIGIFSNLSNIKPIQKIKGLYIT